MREGRYEAAGEPDSAGAGAVAEACSRTGTDQLQGPAGQAQTQAEC